MSIKKIDCAGAKITFKANGGANTEIEVPCIRGDFTYSYGEWQLSEDTCHKEGYTYDKSKFPKWGQDIVWNMYFTGDKTDAFQKLYFEALHNENDFDDNRSAHITIEYADVDANKVELDVFVMMAESTYTPTGYLNLKGTMKQIGLGNKLVLT